MTDIAETIRCTNCKVDILKPNFLIHDIHCQRNIYLCTKCNKPVNHKERDEHDETNHALILCTNCHLEMEKRLLSDHLINDCPHRKVNCRICDIEVNARDITEHENYCGARTERCLGCGEYIMLKYNQLHIDSNHKFINFSDGPAPSPSWRTLGSFFPDFDAICIPPQTQQKKRTGRTESIRRRARGWTESMDKGTKKESSVSDGNGAKTCPKKPGVSDRETSGKSKAQKSQQSRSRAGPQIPDGTDESTGTVPDNGAGSPEEGRKALSRNGSSRSKPESKKNMGTVGKTSMRNKVSDPNDGPDLALASKMNSEIVAKAIDENAAVLSGYSLLDPLEKKESLPEKNAQKNISASMARRVPQLIAYESSDDDDPIFHTPAEHETDQTSLPCQFCGLLYPSHALMSHQRECGLYRDLNLLSVDSYDEAHSDREEREPIITCRICYRLIPYSRYNTHLVLHNMSAANRNCDF